MPFLAPFVPALITAGARLIGGAMNSRASRSAANTQRDAANRADERIMSMYNQTRSDLAPYMSMGTAALGQLGNLWGLNPTGGGGGGPNPAAAMQALTQFPGYQFGMNQGIQALDRSAASRGTVLSGGQRKDITQFGNDYALSAAWAPYMAQLNQFAGMGQNAAASAGGFGANAANQSAQQQLNAGQAVASGQVGQANAWSGALASIAGQDWSGGSKNTWSSYGNNAPAAQGANGVSTFLGGDPLYSLSDERLKEDIERVGTTDEGLGVYTYRLRGESRTQMGVMAQEVERVIPEAVKDLWNGVKVVDYSKLSSPLARVAA